IRLSFRGATSIWRVPRSRASSLTERLVASSTATHRFKRATVFKRKSKSDKPAKAAKPAKSAKPAKAKKEPKAARKARPAALGPVKKRPTDIYTVMLMISMAAVFTACILLLLELNRFGSYPWWNAG